MAQQVSLPPQAYTRETIVKAYEWLKVQPDSIREQANNVDRLVTLYLYSQRQSDSGLTILTPPEKWSPKDLESVEHFKSDLKTLAKGLKQFEKTSPTGSSHFHRPPTSGKEVLQESQVQARVPLEGAAKMSQTNYNTSAQPQGSPLSHGAQVSSSAPWVWDEKSASAIRSTKERFNLSSDQEAVRMLLSIGFEKLRDTFSRGF